MPTPNNIPLRNLITRTRRRSDSEERSPLHSAATRDKEKENKQERKESSDSDDLSYLSEGDIDDPLSEEDKLPLTGRLNTPKSVNRVSREVLYDTSGIGEEKKSLVKEEISIPTPDKSRFRPSKFEVFLAFSMSGDRQNAGTFGLVGKPLLYFTSIFVSLGVFLFGYDQGVMSGIITGSHFNDQFNHPGAAEIGTMVAILEVGAFISSLAVGKIGDLLGRRRTIFFGSMIFFVGGALQTASMGMPTMMLGRIIAGLGVGTLSTIVPIYQSEISPPHNRGKLACIEFTGNILGYAASVWVDYGCSFIDSNLSWRIPLGLQCVMGGLLAAGSLIIPESPR